MLDYINEIIDSFDKADTTGVGTKSSAEPDILLKAENTVKDLIPNKLWGFITWWRKYYLLTIGIDRIHETQFHSSLQERENLTMTIGPSCSV